MTVTFYEGPMDGQKLPVLGEQEGSAYHLGDGVYSVHDEDGEVVAEAKFEDGPPPPPPEVWKAMQSAERRRRRMTLIIAVIAIFFYIGSNVIPTGPLSRGVLDVAFSMLLCAVLIRR